MVRKRKEFVLHETTLSRRSLLEWMGKATVLSLSGSYLASCFERTGGLELGHGPDGSREPPDADPGADIVTPEPEVQADADGPEPAADADAREVSPERELTSDDFPFEAGDLSDAVFSSWGERTVDRQDLASILATWKLSVTGLVANPVELNFAELVGLPRQNQLTDFHCVEGWSVYDVPWNGVHLDRIVELVRPTAAATHVTFWTVRRRYNGSLPLEVALEPKTILGYGVGGDTLPLAHGFPLRAVVPRLLGYKNTKYIEGIEFTDHPVNEYWVDVGYPYDGEVPQGRLREGKY